MTDETIMFQRRERLIAALLWWGTVLASAVISAGVLAGLLGRGGLAVTNIGIALFILLPIARVALMLAIFVRERDHAYTAISGLVLAIIVVGVIAGK
jgi:uncharacterized membrane protein